MEIKISKKWLQPVSIKLLEKVSTDKHYRFRAMVLVWDPEQNKEWSIISRNGARYHRAASVTAFKDAIERNNGIPVMHNHIIEGPDANQLGLITNAIDTDAGLIVEGKLNKNNPVVVNEIAEGFLNNVSLQVDARREDVEEDGKTVAWATPTDVYETSFVNVQGVPGANLMDLALSEAVKAARLKETDVLPGGMGDDSSYADFDKVQFEKGIEVEMEHTDDRKVAEDIVKDHLTEDPKYYDKLEQMENETWDEACGLKKKEAVDEDEIELENVDEDEEITLEESFSEDFTTTTGAGAVAKALHTADQESSETDLSDDEIKKIYDSIVNASK